MKITIRRHGGFAGISETVAVKDASALAAKETAMRATVKQIKLLSQDHHPEGADFSHYDLAIEEPGSKETISFADDGSEKARQLVELVNTISAA